jgi:hypothetical protein
MSIFKNNNFKVLLVLSIVLIIACSSNSEQNNIQEATINDQKPVFSIPDTLKSGVLYTKVAINNDELNSFSLYLPKQYQSDIAWPTVFFFDPSGDGSIPIKKYQSIADSLGYIMIGSNVSKNGQDGASALQLWKSLKYACFNNFTIDKTRIILAGFSGGARVCCAIANSEPNTLGVIANSAGAQNLDQILNKSTFFLGIAGNGDMNRAEMLSIEQHLLGSQLDHYYLEFDGIHEWCPLNIMRKALTIATINSFTKNSSISDPLVIEAFNAEQNFESENFIKNGKWIEAYQALLILKNSTKGMVLVSDIALDSIKENPAFMEQKNELMQITAQETTIQQELYQLMVSQPNITKWKEIIDKINVKSKFKNNVGAMNQRLLGYASLVCYSLSNRNLTAKNYDLAANTIACYEIADPKNAEVYYFKAILFAAKRDTDKTILNLNKSLKLGLNNKIRLANQVEFDFLKEDIEFKELLIKCQF